jgi:hypothetical protein
MQRAARLRAALAGPRREAQVGPRQAAQAALRLAAQAALRQAALAAARRQRAAPLQPAQLHRHPLSPCAQISKALIRRTTSAVGAPWTIKIWVKKNVFIAIRDANV